VVARRDRLFDRAHRECNAEQHGASINTGPRLLLCLPQVIFVPFVPVDALGKGGTNVHERLLGSRATVPTYQPPLPNEGSAGCGRGRYRDPRTHKCCGLADFGS
jgi:hypothetical protein